MPDPGAQHRILLIGPSAPFPLQSGASQRTALLLAALARHADVDLHLLDTDRRDPALLDVLRRDHRLVETPTTGRRWWTTTWLRFAARLVPELRAMWRDDHAAVAIADLVRTGNYDVVVLRYSATACRLLRLRQYLPGIPILVDSDDFLYRLLKHRLGLIARWIERREQRSLLAADGVWVTDAAPAWLARADGTAVVTLPNIPFPADTDPIPRAAIDLLCVAQFRHAPNAEGIDWFLRNIWPVIRTRRPGTTLRLVGVPPAARVAARWRCTPGVELFGPSEDLTGHYASSKLAIAPVRQGAGTKIKVLEALAMGVPCVCTRHAGIGLDTLTSLVITDDAASFAERCAALLDDALTRTALVTRGRREIAQHHTLKSLEAGINTLILQHI